MRSVPRPRYVWDYNIDETEFREILGGRLKIGRLDRDWAAVRVLENAPYEEIVRLIGFRSLVEEWPRWRSRVRSESRRRGLHFLVDWLPARHPEVLANKVSALIDRDEPKDMADIWGFCCVKRLSLPQALTGAAGKAAGIFPPDVARRLLSASKKDWEVIKWITAPEPDRFVSDLHGLGERLVLP